MNLQDWLVRGDRWIRRKLGLNVKLPFDLEAHRLKTEDDRQRLIAEADSELARMVFEKHGRVVDKWTHYPAVYDRHFSKYRGTGIKMLEIGVFKGGSLELWRDYFGPSATIFGVDINPDCKNFVDAPNQVRIGSQDDHEFLKSVVSEMGGVDIILDDGSHIASHQSASFRALFPLLKTGGLYCIEDVHTAYWPGSYEGGYQRPGTAIELAKGIIDDMHSWYHAQGEQWVPATEVLAVHVYDSICVIEKGQKKRPESIRVGGSGNVVP